MIDLTLIGIGTGNPDHLTTQARRAMAGADLILLPRKGSDKADLIDLRRTLCAGLEGPRIVEFDMPVRDGAAAYLGAVHDWHAAITALWRAEIETHLPQGGSLALLVWGDPMLYDSTLRIARRLAHWRNGTGHPGRSGDHQHSGALRGPCHSAQPAGRRRDHHHGPHAAPPWLAARATCVVVMLDDGTTLETLPPEGITVWWGAYLGMEAEALDHGPLALAAPRIARLRAQLRARHGWIMDISLLKKDQTDA
jgi:precorrin-6A synthase